MTSWIGITRGKLIRRCGEPSRIVNDGDGNEIVVYEHKANLQALKLFWLKGDEISRWHFAVGSQASAEPLLSP
jgi:hypothetical protein